MSSENETGQGPEGSTQVGAQAPETLSGAVRAWQAGHLTQEGVVARFTALRRDEGSEVRGAIDELLLGAAGGPVLGAAHGAPETATDAWREELMASRARAWSSPDQAGLLVGPSVLILTDGLRGVVLSAAGTRALTGSVSGSLMLLCQTIVLAQGALDSRTMGDLRQQRIESASTSMSEIEPIS
ncbi:hypothetical protein GCM10008959_34040 [Deinococcus seoulensis]|uniref:Roadblock/LC7 domain-containing protein n=2 Tax=Deinococcus TaxID=1298 RepID=A0ABQ2RXC9_9DEIO|nr:MULTISPECIES: hypothetical protein [Deinococcus]GGR69207.1 hypothetical protein GCM10008959_34040 [Deinococcus seoulensis]GGS37339.1 hypothetical protein GCM10008961_31130 [Deinococcus knuensis]